MTERLFLTDSHLFSCDAAVLSCTPENDAYRVVLDRTVFFPNKGGQPCDTGRVGDACCTACIEEGDTLVHICDRALPVGGTVRACIDAERRTDIMQQHTGEHLLSYFAYEMVGANNVGFHCALTYATLDLDKPLTQDELTALEQRANAFAVTNAAVTATVYETEAEIAELPLRKHAEGIEAPIRLVGIAGADLCTCCAPHVRTTGEIGALVFTDAVAYKGGMRLTFLCGGRALGYIEQMRALTGMLALRFSTARENLPAAVEKQAQELADSRRLVRRYEQELDALTAVRLNDGAEVVRGTRLVVTTLDDVDGKRLRALAGQLMQGKTLAALFSRCGEQVNYLVAVNAPALDAGELISAVNAALAGKGGGRGTLAQGSAKASPATADAIEQLRTYFQKRLG